MIVIGNEIHVETNKIGCPQCARPLVSRTKEASDFWIIACDNVDCEIRGVTVVIEKKTRQIIYTSAIQSSEGVLWPALYREDGTRVWPK